MNELLSIHAFDFNPQDNSGESLVLTTTFLANGDQDGVFFNQELTLSSYCNAASFILTTACLTPEKLRKLADELESELIKAKLKTNENHK